MATARATTARLASEVARVTVLGVVRPGEAADDGDDGDDQCSADSSSAASTSRQSRQSRHASNHRDPPDPPDDPPPHLLDAPVTAGEVLVRHMGLDGVVLRGHHIRALRIGAGLSVMELAARLSFSRSQVHRWECGEASCPSYVLPMLIAAIEAAREEREALLRRARLHLLRWDEEEDRGG